MIETKELKRTYVFTTKQWFTCEMGDKQIRWELPVNAKKNPSKGTFLWFARYIFYLEICKHFPCKYFARGIIGGHRWSANSRVEVDAYYISPIDLTKDTNSPQICRVSTSAYGHQTHVVFSFRYSVKSVRDNWRRGRRGNWLKNND